jgi:hypothetical protein
LFDVVEFDDEDAESKTPYKIEITEVTDENEDGAVDLSDVEYLLKNRKNVLTKLQGDGDFRSKECVELLKEADIVVTNPPFSLFREYVAQLVEYGKQFLILGDQNAVTYKDIFTVIQQDKIWFGYENGGTKWFQVPMDYDIATESRKKVVDGKKFFSMGRIYWYTNLDVSKRHEFLTLYKKFNAEEYPFYVNYDAIEVSRVSDIPLDYDGKMGVPITFLDKYNPEQFEIIGSSRWLGEPMSKFAPKGTYVQGGIRFYLPVDNTSASERERERESTSASTTGLSSREEYRCLYDRIVIRRKLSAAL